MIDRAEWARKNPPRPGESREAYKKRYETESAGRPQAPEPFGIVPNVIEGAEQFGRGALLGLGKTGTSLVGGVGYLTGAKGLYDWSREADREMAEALNPQGTAGKIGEFVGRAGGEIGTSLLGGGLAVKGAAKVAPRLARALGSTSRVQRALATAAVNAPVDVLQGAAAEGGGMALPGRGGAIAENVLFSGAGGALGAALDAARRKPARQITDPRRMLPGAGQTAEFSGAPVPPLRAGRGLPQVKPAGPQQGPALPTRPLSPEQRGVAVVRSTQFPAPEFKAGEQVLADIPAGTRAATPIGPQVRQAAAETAQEVTGLRQQLEQMSERELLDWLEANTGTVMDEPELLRWMAERLGTGRARMGSPVPLQPAEERVLRNLRPAMMSPTRKRPRSGAVEGEVLGTVAGGGLGAAYGATEGETDEQRLVNALLYGTAGAALGAGATRIPRFFDRGVTPSTPADKRSAIAQAAEDLQRGPLKAPKMGPAGAFPENRRPLLERTDLGAAEKVLLADRISRLEPGIRRPFTEQEYRRGVQDVLGKMDLRELAAIDPKRATPEEAGAILDIVRDIRTQIADRTAQLGSLDAEDAVRMADEIDAMDETGSRMLALLMRADTAAGRSLAARRYMARDITDPTYWYIKGVRTKGGEMLSQAERDMIDRLAKEGDSTKLLQYMAGLQKSSVLEQVAQLRSAGLLTAIPGRLRDLLSTTANYVSTVAQRAPGSLVDVAASNMAAKLRGGDAAQFRSVAAPTMDEMSAAFRGIRTGLRDAAQSMGVDAARAGGMQGWVDFIRQAEIDPEMAARLDVPSLINFDLFGTSRGGQAANAFVDTYAKAVMRSSGVTDKILRSVARNGALVEQANLMALRKGLKGDAAQEFVQRAVTNPTDEMALNAQMVADYITFTNDGTLAQGIGNTVEMLAGVAGRRSPGLDAIVRAGARIVMPFRRTPANILTRALEYAPGSGQVLLANAAKDWHKALVDASLTGTAASAEIAKRQRQMVELFTKQATGAGMFGLGAYLYNQGVLTGELPEAQAEQEQWRLEGRQPESLLVNGQWVPIARISPYGGMMTMAASMLQNIAAKSGESVTKQLYTGAGVAGRSLLNQPMVTGPKEALEAAVGRSQSGEPMERYVQGIAGSFVPTGVAQLARSEGVQRLPQTMAQQVTSRIPGLQETAPARLNIFGEPVQKASGALNVAVNPLPFTRDVRSTDPLVRELSTTGVNIAAMAKKKGESMDLYQYRQREAGRYVREDLEALVQSPTYQEADLTQKRQLIQRTVRSARDEFARWLKENYQIEDEQQ